MGFKVPKAVGPMWGELREHSEVTNGSMSRCQRKHILRPVATLVRCKFVQDISFSCLLLYLLFRWPTRAVEVSEAYQSPTNAVAVELTQHRIRLVATPLESLLRLIASNSASIIPTTAWHLLATYPTTHWFKCWTTKEILFRPAAHILSKTCAPTSTKRWRSIITCLELSPAQLNLIQTASGSFNTRTMIAAGSRSNQLGMAATWQLQAPTAERLWGCRIRWYGGLSIKAERPARTGSAPLRPKTVSCTLGTVSRTRARWWRRSPIETEVPSGAITTMRHTACSSSGRRA